MPVKVRPCLNPLKASQVKLTCQDYLSQTMSLYWIGTLLDITVTFLICIQRGPHTLLQLFYLEFHSSGSVWAGTFSSRHRPLYKRNFPSLLTTAPKTVNFLFTAFCTFSWHHKVLVHPRTFPLLRNNHSKWPEMLIALDSGPFPKVITERCRILCTRLL